MKKTLTYMLCLLAIVACKKNEVNFSYSPAEPRAGESVRFSNLTSEGEDWAWDFGESSTSTTKSPVKTFRLPGTYKVTLKVDNKLSRTCTKMITVYDSVPCIGLTYASGDSIVRYFAPVTLSALSYNPFGHQQTYEWLLPQGTIILSGDTTKSKIQVCFTVVDDSATVRCNMTQGDQTFSLAKTFFVANQAARAVVLAQPGQVLHQRIFQHGVENATAYALTNALVNKPASMLVKDNMLYVFNADNSTNGCIASFDLESQNLTSSVIIRNGNSGDGYGFYHGTIIGDQIYWTVADCIYRAPLNSKNQSFIADGDFLFCKASQIGQTAGLTAGGIARYNGLFFYAYGNGIHRFAGSEIGSTPAAASILTDKTITRFALDPIARKIYFVAADGLSVATIDGENVTLIDANANGNSLCVDNDGNRLYWTTNQGVFYLPLVQTPNNKYTASPALLNELSDVTAIAIDGTPRKL